jgi:predicted DNA-binding transcriptional regulator AlpA
MITNIREAAKYLGISARTVIRMINDGIFPEPSQSIEIGKGKILRSWKEKDLDAFRSHLRPAHRPKISDKKCHTK